MCICYVSWPLLPSIACEPGYGFPEMNAQDLSATGEMMSFIRLYTQRFPMPCPRMDASTTRRQG